MPSAPDFEKILAAVPREDVNNLAAVLAVALETGEPVKLTITADRSGRRRTFIVTAHEVANG